MFAFFRVLFFFVSFYSNFNPILNTNTMTDSTITSSSPTTNAWVTLATTDGYAVGALVLAHSLRQVNTAHKLHVMYTAGVSSELRAQLQQVFDDSTEVNVLDSGDAENLALIGRPDLGVTFTKLHCWRLTQYSKCVFLDADTFIVQNCDELFERPEFSAAPDIGWPDCFNTGVFVFVPSMETYRSLVQFSITHGSFDGGDQGLLNAYFSGWRESDASHRLPFLYNVTTGAIYSYAAALKKFAPQVKIIHFLGKQKPWLQHYERGATEGLTFVSQYHQQWRDVYNQLVQQHLPTTAMVSDQFSAQQHANERLSSFSDLTERPFTISVGDPVEGFQYQHQRTVARIPSQQETDVATAETATGEELSAAQNSAFEETENQGEIPFEMSIADPSTSSESMGLGRLEAWEHGMPDYAGADSFENIQKAMEKSLE